jgi:AmmeMemoRadiSam system protein B
MILPLPAQTTPDISLRTLADTVGYANLDWQMDSIMARISSLNQDDLIHSAQATGTVWRTAICPYDDYAYAGWLYHAVLRNITARTVIIFGVAHKARLFNLENQLVFDSFKSWRGPCGLVKVSALRDKIISHLPAGLAVIHDSMQTVEHSVEGLIPFLQYQSRDIEIISILVPYMALDRMKKNQLTSGDSTVCNYG